MYVVTTHSANISTLIMDNHTAGDFLFSTYICTSRLVVTNMEYYIVVLLQKNLHI